MISASANRRSLPSTVVRVRPRYTRLAALILACLCLMAARSLLAADEEEGSDKERVESKSPDGRFACVYVYDEAYAEGDEPSSFKIIDAASKQVLVANAGSEAESFQHSLTSVWAKDSRHLALNYRAGGRYDTFTLYAWDGKTFQVVPSPMEEALSARLDVAFNAQLKKQRISKKAYGRRIWDTYKVQRWIDARTLQVAAYTDKLYDGETDVTAALRFRVRLAEGGKAQVLQATPIPVKEANKEDE